MKKLSLIFLLFFISLESMGQMENNVAVYDSLRSICDTIKDPKHQEKVYYEMCMSASSADFVFLYAMKLLNLSRKTDDLYFQGVANSLIAWVYSAQNVMDKSVDYIMESIKCYQECDSTRQLIMAYNQLGSTYANMNNIDAALETFRLSLKLAKEAGHHDLERTASNCIGFVYVEMKLFRFAMDYLIDLKPDLSTSHGYDLWANSQIGLIQANLSLYQDGDGFPRLDAAYKIAKSLNEDSLRNINPITYLNYTLVAPQVYIERSRLKNQRINLDTAEQIMRRGIIYASSKSIDVFESQHKLIQCLIFMEKKYYDLLPPLIQELDTTLQKEGKSELLDIMYNYYKFKRDYPKILDVMELKSKIFNNKYRIDFAMRNENSVAVEGYREQMNIIAEHEMVQIRQQEYERRLFTYAKAIILVLLIFVIIVAVNFIINNRQMRKVNSIMMGHNLKLKETTDELTKAQAEYQNQCSEILEQTQVLNEQRVDLKMMNRYLNRGMESAKLMQRAVVPSPQSVENIVGESFVFWRPLDSVSGDFYWTAQRGRRRFLIVADCTGHGVPGALLSILGSSILNSLLPQIYNIDASQILELYKAKFKETICKNTSIDDGMDLALIVFEGGNRIQYAGANRPLMLVRNGELTEYKADRICIGNNFYKEHLRFTNYEITTEKGDMLYAFSDGLTDQFGGIEGRQKFSIRTMKKLLCEISHLPMESQKKQIGNAIDNWRKSNNPDGEMYPQIDDELVIGVRVG
ncbi:MAG: SpoIIE family protein phosphatase [Bacteroidales bacterium]|nr:SpoIIE family protein phosphatase [Bacteroidales bacterium]